MVPNLILFGEELITVDRFRYLGNCLTKEVRTMLEVGTCICNFEAACNGLKHVWRVIVISVRLKGRGYCASMRSALLQNCGRGIRRLKIFVAWTILIIYACIVSLEWPGAQYLLFGSENILSATPCLPARYYTWLNVVLYHCMFRDHGCRFPPWHSGPCCPRGMSILLHSCLEHVIRNTVSCLVDLVVWSTWYLWQTCV